MNPSSPLMLSSLLDPSRPLDQEFPSTRSGFPLVLPLYQFVCMSPDSGDSVHSQHSMINYG
jgi:hypothetical protein